MSAAQMIPFAALKTAYAKKINKPEDTAAKQLRARLRSNFDTLASAAPASYGKKGKVKETANDKRPWGDIPATFVRDTLGVTIAPARARKPKAEKVSA